MLPPLRLAAKGRGERGAARTLPVRAIAMGTNGCCGRLENPGVFRTHGSWWHCLHTRYARGIFCPRSTTVNRPASSHTRYHRDTRGSGDARAGTRGRAEPEGYLNSFWVNSIEFIFVFVLVPQSTPCRARLL